MSTIPLRQAALAAELVETEGLSLRQAEAKTGIDHVTIGRIINRVANWGEITDTPVFRKHRETQNKALEAAYRTAAAISLDEAYKPAKLKKASHYQLVMSSAVAIDKARLLAGEPTQITEVVNTGNLELLAAKLSEAVQLRAQAKPEEIDITPSKEQGLNTPAATKARPDEG